MDFKREEKLIEFAFGELEASDALELQGASARDLELQKQVSEWAALREDLKSLRDIPEMQLSNERLRDAILGEALKPSKPTPWWQFVLAPVATVAVVAMIAPMLWNRTQPTKFIGSDAVAFHAPSGREPLFTRNQDVEPAASMAASTSAIQEKGPVRAKPSEPRTNGSYSRAKRSQDKAMIGQLSLASRGKGSTSVPPGAAVMTMTSQGADAATMAVESTMPTVDSGVILIDSTTDVTSGAQIATELENTQNVVVGG